MHVVSVSSLKGGVGKTTVALGLASAAAARGLSTLIVDLDPQCDATTGLGAIGEFAHTTADVLQSPRHNVVHRAIVASTWEKILPSKIDVMVGSPKVQMVDHPAPSIKELWRLEDALAKVEKDYDLVIVDTPPSINGLTKTAWVASDRILVVTEPSLFSVVAADRSIRAINELRKGVTRRLKIHGVVVNRFKPLSREHVFRVNELQEKYASRLLPQMFEEKATIQQAQGAARPIHAWTGETSVAVAKLFDGILEGLLEDIRNNPHSEPTRLTKRQARRDKKTNRSKRGRNLESLLGNENESLNQLETMTGEVEIPAPFIPPQPVEPVAEPVEEVVTPPTAEELFEELMRETQRKLHPEDFDDSGEGEEK